ncbi:MAG: winged helix-turn-helix transcriptional regulator [Candidatus Doudnabacteria bacterium]|nr:winged helix-turn-helix transcriptional regulator [Candidatus Doudnabacteria bacterium]
MRKDKRIIKKQLRDNKAIEECACRFGIVGDPTRMKICWLLHHYPELSVSGIAELLGVSVSAVSHSLKKLKQNEIVEARRSFRQVFYRLKDTDFNKIIKQSLP